MAVIARTRPRRPVAARRPPGQRGGRAPRSCFRPRSSRSAPGIAPVCSLIASCRVLASEHEPGDDDRIDPATERLRKRVHAGREGQSRCPPPRHSRRSRAWPRWRRSRPRSPGRRRLRLAAEPRLRCPAAKRPRRRRRKMSAAPNRTTPTPSLNSASPSISARNRRPNVRRSAVRTATGSVGLIRTPKTRHRRR